MSECAGPTCDHASHKATQAAIRAEAERQVAVIARELQRMRSPFYGWRGFLARCATSPMVPR